MVDLPQLSGSINRRLKLKWEKLIEKHSFTGAHLDWPVTRRVKVHTEATPPPRDIRDRHVSSGLSIRQRPSADWLYGDTDKIGSKQTVDLAKQRFDEVADEYFSLWSLNAHANYEQYSAWLEEIRMLVLGEVRKLWETRGDWFDRYCTPIVNDALAASVREWTSKARDTDLKRLLHEVPAESVPTEDSIVASNGDRAAIGTPTTLPRGTISPPPSNRPTVMDWSDLAITFLSEHRVSIRVSIKVSGAIVSETRSYAEMGFQDGRVNQKGASVPVAAWNDLIELGKRAGGESLRLPKERAQQLRKLLRKHFRIEADDPLTFDRKGHGYIPRFQVRIGPSFDA